MSTQICLFENNPITFSLDKESVMVNATEMAKIFGKEVAHFMENKSTKRFISCCLKTWNSAFLNFENMDDLYTSKQKTGTFMHRILALKFAAWLDPDFELWVYATIEEILFGKYVQRDQSFERTIALQKEADAIINNPQKTVPDFERYLEIEKLLKRETAVRKSLTSENISQLKLLFD